MYETGTKSKLHLLKVVKTLQSALQVLQEPFACENRKLHHYITFYYITLHCIALDYRIF